MDWLRIGERESGREADSERSKESYKVQYIQ